MSLFCSQARGQHLRFDDVLDTLKQALADGTSDLFEELLLPSAAKQETAHASQLLSALRASRLHDSIDFAAFREEVVRLFPDMKIATAVDEGTNVLKAFVCMTPRMTERLHRYHEIVFLGSFSLECHGLEFI